MQKTTNITTSKAFLGVEALQRKRKISDQYGAVIQNREELSARRSNTKNSMGGSGGHNIVVNTT